MKTHTTAGAELLTHAKEELGESGYLNIAMEMAAYHHEWWNGKGYPYGIIGEEIPLCARIMAAAEDIGDNERNRHLKQKKIIFFLSHRQGSVV
jgi:HD-GYP domain-containing protein (c-di-GMP phosphodiesterase class II)